MLIEGFKRGEHIPTDKLLFSLDLQNIGHTSLDLCIQRVKEATLTNNNQLWLWQKLALTRPHHLPKWQDSVLLYNKESMLWATATTILGHKWFSKRVMIKTQKEIIKNSIEPMDTDENPLLAPVHLTRT